MGRLVAEGALVEEVTDETEAEDGGGQEVAGYLGIAAESAGEELGAVFCGDVLDDRVIGRLGSLGWLGLRGRTSAGDDAREGLAEVAIV